MRVGIASNTITLHSSDYCHPSTTLEEKEKEQVINIANNNSTVITIIISI